MKISVLVTTYNGSKYILEQLESIKNQTKKADEVIICDDRSSDDTVDIIDNFIKTYKLENWKIIINKNNLGWKRNFIENLKYIKGDIVFFCDQDDIWDKNKIEIMYNAMKKNEDILALSCYVRLINEKNEKIPLIKNLVANGNNTGEVYKNNFNKEFIYQGVAGCTMAFRYSLYKYIEEIDCRCFAHDKLLWELALLFDGAYNIDLELLSYRVHSKNVTSPNDNCIGKRSNNERISNIDILIKICNLFLNIINSNDIREKKKKINILKNTIDMLSIRIKILEYKKIYLIFNIIMNKAYAIPKSMAIGDLCYALNINKFAGNVLYKIYNKNVK